MLLATTGDDSIIRLESRHLTVTNNDCIAGIVPLNLLNRVILSDMAQVSGMVIQELLKRHIPVIMLTADGKYLGQIHYSPRGDNERKRLQYGFVPESNLLPAKRLLDAKRLKKISRLCLDYGFRIQYSVFSMDFDEKRLHCFIQELKGMISLDTDRVMLIPICKNCSQSTFIFREKVFSEFT